MMHFKHDISDIEVAKNARMKGIVVKPLSTLYLNAPAQQGLLLGYSGFDLRKLRAASLQLSEVVKSAVRKSGSTRQPI
jgi:GntR family transcriptional regulator/MocR family aminotransferase